MNKYNKEILEKEILIDKIPFEELGRKYGVSGTGGLFCVRCRQKTSPAPDLLKKRERNGYHLPPLPLRGMHRLPSAGTMYKVQES